MTRSLRAIVFAVACHGATFGPATAQADGPLPIADSDPLYATLAPVARRIANASSIEPPIAIRFTIVEGRDANAFAAPNDRILITRGLFGLLANRDELAGVLCHEVAHLAAHDEARERGEAEHVATDVAVAGALLGTNRTLLGLATQSEIGRLATKRYSRSIELAADARGVATCARAGYNPWGLVWVLRSFDDVAHPERFEILSDHPFARERIEALEDLFRSDSGTYARYSSDPASSGTER